MIGNRLLSAWSLGLSECFNVGQSKVLNRALDFTALNILLEKCVSDHTFAELCLIFEATQLRRMNTSKGAVSPQVQKTMAKEKLNCCAVFKIFVV